MINTLVKNYNKSKLSLDSLINNIYLLPKWEMIKSFSLTENVWIFKTKSINVNLYRKFSSKNLVEKYCIKSSDEKILANMDLKIYKDCVYIINFDIKPSFNFEQLANKMLQIAIEKSIYNTTKKEVRINLIFPLVTRNRIKKFLLKNEFLIEKNQSAYEKKMFGETLFYNNCNNSKWGQKINQMPILINK